VEILTSPTHSPSKDWLKFVKTTRAKARIKHWIEIEERKRSLDIGRRLLERELRKSHLSPTECFKSEKLLGIAKEMGINEVDELLVSLGYGKISAHQIVNRLLSDVKLKEGLKEKLVRSIGLREQGVKIKGVDDIMIHFSKCCSPVPGDRIIGFITRGRGLSIHAVDCPNIDELDYDKDRLLEVDWDTEGTMLHPVKISVLSVDKPGLLASVSSSISSTEANISHAEINTTDDQRAVLNFVVNIHNRNHLEQILKKIEQVEGVLQARRVRKG
jgi:GTP pyrophosphokinase